MKGETRQFRFHHIIQYRSKYKIQTAECQYNIYVTKVCLTKMSLLRPELMLLFFWNEKLLNILERFWVSLDFR